MQAVCCSQCFNQIAGKDKKAAELWLSLCANYIGMNGPFQLRERKMIPLFQLFRKLETMGYILTADGADVVNVRVNGYDMIELPEEKEGLLCLDTFCINRDEHKIPWA